MKETPDKALSRGQALILGSATVPMVAFGALGAWGTYSNITSVFHRSATALGVVAAGEGATLVLALVLVGLTMLGQSSPAAVRIGLWTLPAVASLTGAAVAKTTTEAVVFAITPMAMCVSAEGMGLLARRIVVYRTGMDAEAQRRNAEVMQRLAYHRARAANHPDEKARKASELESWKLAKRVGTGDAELGSHLVEVQRERMTAGADAALAGMFALPVTPPAVEATATRELPAATAPVDGCVAPPVTPEDTQVTPDAETIVPERVTPVTQGPVTPVTPDGEPVAEEPDEVRLPAAGAVTLDEVAAVAGVTTPEPATPLTDTQLIVVLRHLRYSVDPPMSYRQAAAAFREGGYVGGEKRVRAAWGALLSHEENEV
ncbi:hypothetical protein [Streptomyces sp. NPDC001530]|uniref:hypothetical protein n=1 Tax=Streptomyces sp. NPDC001530 TaxID=3364582 RepID=UPI00368174A9